MSEFYIIIAWKYIFPNLGGHVLPRLLRLWVRKLWRGKMVPDLWSSRGKSTTTKITAQNLPWERAGETRAPGVHKPRPPEDWRSCQLFVARNERRSVAQCVYDTGWPKSKSKMSSKAIVQTQKQHNLKKVCQHSKTFSHIIGPMICVQTIFTDFRFRPGVLKGFRPEYRILCHYLCCFFFAEHCARWLAALNTLSICKYGPLALKFVHPCYIHYIHYSVSLLYHNYNKC